MKNGVKQGKSNIFECARNHKQRKQNKRGSSRFVSNQLIETVQNRKVEQNKW